MLSNKDHTEELLSCERHICERKESFYKRYGLKRILERDNSGQMLFLVLPSSILGLPGFIILYIVLSIKNRMNLDTVYKGKIVYDDHGTKVIERAIFDRVMAKKEEDLTVMSRKCPVSVLINMAAIKQVMSSYRRVKPVAPNVKYALCEFWLYYNQHIYTLPRENYAGTLVVDDFSANRVALTLAAKDTGMRTGLVRLSDEMRRPSPFSSYDVLFCWHSAQALEERGKYKVVGHLERKYKEIKSLSTFEHDSFTVGISLKSNINKEGLVRQLEELNQQEWVRKVLVRYHPSTKPSAYLPQNGSIKYIVSDGSEENFFTSIDLLISGSTSLVKAALLAGVPVVYDAELDAPGGEDFYAYRKQGVIIDFTEKTIEKDSFASINYFFDQSNWKKLRNSWVEPNPDAVSPAEAMDYLCQSGKNGVRFTGEANC